MTSSRIDTEIVSALQVALAERVGRERFDLWFGVNTQLRVRDKSLTVEVATPFFCEWLRANFKDVVHQCCVDLLGGAATVDFIVQENIIQQDIVQEDIAPADPQKRPAAALPQDRGPGDPDPPVTPSSRGKKSRRAEKKDEVNAAVQTRQRRFA